MADTQAKANGPIDGDKQFVDSEDPEYQRQMRRPADIDQDMKEMERRKRVEMILNSKMFREELERIIEAQLREGYHPASLLALQQISELVLPHAKFNGASLFKGASCVIPISDIRGVDSFAYAKGEKLLRCKLAALYRLIDLFGWSQGIYNHVTVRITQDLEHFLINPFGVLYHEITASSLIKVDMQGNVLEQGTTNYGINLAGYVLHSAIHAARPDIKCIIHVHVPACVAVSALKCGLLPISQESLVIGDVSYHEYQGIISDADEKEVIARDLGPTNKVLILRNHGIVCCGDSIEEAFYHVYNTVSACETQVKLMPLGLDQLHLIPEDVQKKVYETARRGGGGVNSKQETEGEKTETKERSRKWKVGELEFEGLMRMLDNAGFRTGYMYKQPLTRSEPPKPKSDVEVPPTSSSYTYIFDEDDLLKYSPFKKIMEGRKAQDKTRWLNSPNVYQKVEVLETGTSDPKKITKWVTVANGGETEWVAEGSPTHSSAVKIESPHQFVPPGTDPAEFKRKQKEIKENRMKATVTAGPQSHVLEGVSWEEIKKLQDAGISGTGDQVFVVGAASKGIIQREFQHNAMVYKTPYAKNPFDSVTDEELEEYKRIVEKKQRGEPFEEEKEEPVQSPIRSPVGGVPVFPPGIEGDATPTQGVRSPPQSPISPMSDEEVLSPVLQQQQAAKMQRSYSARLPPQAAAEIQASFQRRTQSIRESKSRGDATVNGDETDAKEGLRSPELEDNVSGASRSSKEGSPTKEAPGGSPKKEKKKKKGLKTPSFLKKKKDKSKKKEEAD